MNIVHQRIAAEGFLTVADYMALCLLHPEHGYYTTQQVFGTQGDFTTAPEISQLFGEIIGVWALLEWERLGRPASFDLVELGPGRGTLMNDLLRATAAQAEFLAALHVHFVEASPQLRELQKQAIKTSGVDAQWHEKVDGLVFERPVLLIANEFFDALPVRQFVVQDRIWHERIIVENDGKLHWSVSAQPADGRLLPSTQYQHDGTLCEHSEQAAAIFKTLCQNIKMAGGSLLVIDYGDHTVNRFGDTLQAMKDHDYVEVLEAAGQADLTTHVDFYQLDEIASNLRLTTDFISQADFLQRYGITERVNALTAQGISISEKNAVLSGYQRLIDPAQMGKLFKVLMVQTP